MRYTTEFKIVPDPCPIPEGFKEQRLNHLKQNGLIRIGELVTGHIPFKCLPPTVEGGSYYKLSFEAFSLEKWFEFKKGLRDLIMQMKPETPDYWLLQAEGLFKELDKIQKDGEQPSTEDSSHKEGTDTPG